MIAVAVAALGMAGAAQAAPRVISLDSCADQYVLALSPRDQVAGLSMRADDADSRLRVHARGLPKRRIDLESVLGARPDIVVRYWGGDPKLLQALEKRGVRIVTLAETHDFDGVRGNIARVSAELGQAAKGRAIIARMDGQLASSAGAWRGASAAYMTPGALTAGRGTLIDAILRGAGMRNSETGEGFRPISLEQLALSPPRAMVLGFFDTFQLSGAFWGQGRHDVLRKAVKTRAVASLPGALLSCPDAGAAEAVARLAEAAR